MEVHVIHLGCVTGKIINLIYQYHNITIYQVSDIAISGMTYR